MKSNELVKIGSIIQLTETWLAYPPGTKFKVVSIQKPRVGFCSVYECFGCIQCEGWTDHACLISDKDVDQRNFEVTGVTGNAMFRDGHDIINIVGMV